MRPNFSHQAQRVAIFIDVQNLYHSAKNLFKAKVNFENAIKYAIKNRALLRIFAYVVKTEDTPGETAFFDALKSFGIELRIKDLQIFPGGMKKGDWDVGMTVDAIRLAPSVDAVVLATGDGDFTPLVEYLQAQGKFVEVMAFSKSASSKLKEQADSFIDLGEKPKTFLLPGSKN
ncbi:MAG: NYN domain-containing protein [Patescibacteria group bacterium]